MKTWVLTKVLAFLTTQEGCTVDSNTENGVILQDVFGFRYELKVTLLGRISTQAPLEGFHNVSALPNHTFNEKCRYGKT